MGRKKLIGEITNEKILGKLPKVKSNLGSLDFDEDSIDGISILSFKTFDDLKEYYPLEKIQPDHLQEQPKKEPKKRKIRSDKGEKCSKPKVKRKPVVKQAAALGVSNLAQFDKSESEGEDSAQKNLLVKTEESPPPSPLPEIPGKLSGEAPVHPPALPTAIKSEGCSTSSSTPVIMSTAPSVTTTCGSGSPVYQPAPQHIPIPVGATGATKPPVPTPPTSLPTPPSVSAPPTGPFYPGLHRHPVAPPSHTPHGIPFHFAHHGASGTSHHAPPPPSAPPTNVAELEMKMNAAKYDARYLLSNGRFPSPAFRAAEYDRYLLSRSLVGGSRPLFPTSAPRPPAPTPPVNPAIIPNRTELSAGTAAGSSAGTAIKRRLEKRWNSIHVHIAWMIYKDQKLKKQTKDPLNGAAAAANGSVPGASESAAARSFLANSKREVMREYPQFPGMHNLPPTPASPFPPHAAPFAQSLHPAHHSLGLRGIQSLHGLGQRYPSPSTLRAPYAAAAAAAGLYHPGFDPLRLPSELSRLEQERLHQHLRSSELLSRSMYENSMRQREAEQAQHQQQQQQQQQQLIPPGHVSREMLLHMEEQRRKLLAATSDPQKLMNPGGGGSIPNLAELYMHPQHLQAQLKYPPVGPSSHLAQFPHLLNRLDPRARFSHLIPQPKGPE